MKTLPSLVLRTQTVKNIFVCELGQVLCFTNTINMNTIHLYSSSKDSPVLKDRSKSLNTINRATLKLLFYMTNELIHFILFYEKQRYHVLTFVRG